VANGISKLGRPEGISKLIGLLETKPETAGIISNALSKARTPTAITQLKDRLLQDPELSNSTSDMIGSALGAMGTPQAVKALLTLATNAQDEETQQKIFTWLGQINDERSIQLLLSAQDEYRFADPQFGLRLQELGQQIDNSSLAPMPLIAGMPELPDLAMAPPASPEMTEEFAE
jgi:HEAT repeat protein